MRSFELARRAVQSVKKWVTAKVVAVGTLTIAGASSAMAAGIDTTAAIAGVTDAQTALLALLGAFIGLSAAIYGVAKVYAFLKRKAGG